MPPSFTLCGLWKHAKQENVAWMDVLAMFEIRLGELTWSDLKEDPLMLRVGPRTPLLKIAGSPQSMPGEGTELDTDTAEALSWRTAKGRRSYSAP